MQSINFPGPPGDNVTTCPPKKSGDPENVWASAMPGFISPPHLLHPIVPGLSPRPSWRPVPRSNPSRTLDTGAGSPVAPVPFESSGSRPGVLRLVSSPSPDVLQSLMRGPVFPFETCPLRTVIVFPQSRHRNLSATFPALFVTVLCRW